MNEIKFAEGSVPVAVAAKVYGKDASWIRAGIISGWLPIGKATRNGKLVTSLEEMLIALAFRCEEHIMSDPEVGNRMGQWFWSMIVSLGLSHMTDQFFDLENVNNVIFRFMEHQYDRNGNGGLFTIDDCKYDLRTVEIWWQMNWYLDSIL